MEEIFKLMELHINGMTGNPYIEKFHCLNLEEFIKFKKESSVDLEKIDDKDDEIILKIIKKYKPSLSGELFKGQQGGSYLDRLRSLINRNNNQTSNEEQDIVELIDYLSYISLQNKIHKTMSEKLKHKSDFIYINLNIVNIKQKIKTKIKS